MADRRDIGSWLEPAGPPAHEGGLDLPEAGSGSLARPGRRLIALAIDWVACLLIANAFLGGHPLAPLAVFAVENLVLVGFVGATLGHRIAGIRVLRLEVAQGGVGRGIPGVGLVRSLARTVLLCLVIPAVVWDGDGRGMHDRAAGTVIVRR